jgi:hypothetical protein
MNDKNFDSSKIAIFKSRIFCMKMVKNTGEGGEIKMHYNTFLVL